MHTIRRSYTAVLVFLILLLAASTAHGATPGNGASATVARSTPSQETVARIQAAMGAAPLAVALQATILDWPAQPGGEFTLLREGSNGYTCLPPRAGRPTPDPMCLDEIWMAWLTDRMAGKVPNKEGIGVAYMLQGGNSPSASDPSLRQPPEGQDWVIDPPHVMLLSPEPLDTSYYPVTPDAGGPWILYAGTPYEILMIPVDSDLALEGDRIADAISAAPSHASADATVLEWPAAAGAGVTELRGGDAHYTCLPPRAGRPSPDPMCLDPVWLAWFTARMAGEVSDKQGIGIAYMLQGGNSPSASDPSLRQPPEGEGWVLDPPHVMLLSPDALDAAYFPAVPDAGGPWILYAGSPYEILMIPVALGPSDAQTERALLPLPQSLRDAANIVVFDADWNSIVVREGSSDIHCVAAAPFMAIQYAVCQHKSSQAFWVMGMQLRAGGMGQAKIDQARIDAMVDGSLEIPVVGAARYFLVGGRPQELFTQMAVHLPYATSASTGFSTQPDSYRPWLMDAGTPNAHVMLPGN